MRQLGSRVYLWINDGEQCRTTRMMFGVILVDKVTTDVLWDRVGVVVKIEDMITQSCLQWNGHVIC